MNPKIATAKATIELLVAAEKPHAGVANVDAWLTSVAKRIRGEHWDPIMDLLDTDPSLTAEQLAGQITDAKAEADPRPSTAVQHAYDRHACRQCGCYGGGGFLPMAERCEDGTVPGVAIPCPTCSVDRHRQHAATVRGENGAKW